MLQNDFILALLKQWEYVVLYLAASALISGVVLNFVSKFEQSKTTAKKEPIVVATLTMTLFFIVIFVIGKFEIGRIPMSEQAEFASKVFGCFLVVFGSALNLAGRISLGRFWSDQIEIQEEHQIVRKWPYSWSRHPMYGSLIIFGFGMGLLSINPIVITVTLIIFVPAMIYRASREEELLVEACGDEYRQYQAEVSMLLPRLPEWISKFARAGIAAIQVWGVSYQLLDVFLLSALLTLGLSFLMQRDDFRIAYKIKPFVIVMCVVLVAMYPSLAVLLWIPTLASLMSLTGQCPGTLIVRAVKYYQSKEMT